MLLLATLRHNFSAGAGEISLLPWYCGSVSHPSLDDRNISDIVCFRYAREIDLDMAVIIAAVLAR
jgi:hypothetical protein